MKPKPHKPRFLTREAILAAIDKTNQTALEKGQLGEKLDDEYRRLIAVIEDNRRAGKRSNLAFKLDEVRDMADKAWAARSRLLTGKLKRLKNKLSELMTPMALVGTGRDDDSVNA